MTAKDFDYAAAMSELQQLLSDMQAEEVSVDEAMEKYERGQELIRRLRDYLEAAENRITVRKVA